MTPCIEWTGARHRFGYGDLRIGGKLYRAHRLAWEREHGPIPAGMSVLHRCDNPPCYNVDHLFLGTQADNNRDMAAKGRHWLAGRTHCMHGHPFTPDNLVVSSLPRRDCRECSNRRGRECRARRRERLTS